MMRPERARRAAGVAVVALMVGVLTACGGPGAMAPRRFGSPTVPTTTRPALPLFLAPTSDVSQSTLSDGNADCGGLPSFERDGTHWVCTFDDEFDGTNLNPSLWTVEQTAVNGYHSGNECYVESPANVSVSGGALHLTAIATAAPFRCPDPAGEFTTTYSSGMVSTYNTFSQTDGYFEVKAKFPSATVPGLQSSLWLWPQDRNTYGRAFPDSGEIDIAEWYSDYPRIAIPTAHYDPLAGPGTDPDATTNRCVVQDPAKFNVYGLLWTSSSLTFVMDGRTCLTDVWDPAEPEIKPEPFNLPFYLNLTEAIGFGADAPSADAPLPATMEIDWVRVWTE
jgi:beta-glucanase (GH16 family)